MAGKREEIDTGNDKRYVRRDDQGQFNESDDQGRSLSQDQRHDAKAEVHKHQGTGVTVATSGEKLGT